MPLEEKKREKIEREAKQLLDKFSKMLSQIKPSESNVERSSDRRKEGAGKIGEEDFRKAMLENSPRHDGDLIVAEKKSW